MIYIGTIPDDMIKHGKKRMPLVLHEFAAINGDIDKKWLIAIIISEQLNVNLKEIY